MNSQGAEPSRAAGRRDRNQSDGAGPERDSPRRRSRVKTRRAPRARSTSPSRTGRRRPPPAPAPTNRRRTLRAPAPTSVTRTLRARARMSRKERSAHGGQRAGEDRQSHRGGPRSGSRAGQREDVLGARDAGQPVVDARGPSRAIGVSVRVGVRVPEACVSPAAGRGDRHRAGISRLRSSLTTATKSSLSRRRPMRSSA